MERVRKIVVPPEEEQLRLDIFLVRHLKLSRTQIGKLIAEGKVTVNNLGTKAHYKVRRGDNISIIIPEPKKLEVKPEEIPLDILYEDGEVVVLNKPAGMVVHPASGVYSGTLVNALLSCWKALSGIGGVLRPGIVHRLDKDTSGVLVVAKTDKAHLSLAKQLQERQFKKVYLALVHGDLKEEGEIEAPIGRSKRDRKKMAVTGLHGRGALTHFKVLERFGDYTLVEVRPETGRTHQIRVHLAYIGHPLVGDPKYGRRKDERRELEAGIHEVLKRQGLHAQALSFTHPVTGESMEFEAPLPADLAAALAYLRKRQVKGPMDDSIDSYSESMQ